MRLTFSTLLVAIALVSCTPSPEPATPPTPAAEYQYGLSQAQIASQKTQDATTIGQWQDVAAKWESAIAALQKLSTSDPNYAVAQEKVAEYSKNLAYSQHAIAQLQAKEAKVNARVKQISGAEPKPIDWKQGVAIAVPEQAWKQLSTTEKAILIDGIKSPTGWAVIVGKVQGESITLDREVCNPELLREGKCI